MGCFRALLPCIGSFAAFLLGMLCIFAGNQRQLPQVDLLTLYTHGIGTPSTENAAPAPDFFSVYPMSYCSGFQVPDPKTNFTTTQNRLFACSDRSVLFRFNPTSAILKAVGNESGTLASDIWPSCITDDFGMLQPTNSTMVIFYIFGTTAAAVAVGVRLWSLASARALGRARSRSNDSSRRSSYPGRSDVRFEFDNPPSRVELVALLVSMIGLGIGSVIASMIATEFVTLINMSGNAYGVSATAGSTFLGLTWTAEVLQVLGTTDTAVAIFRSRAKRCWCDLDERVSLPELAEEKPLVGGD
ncbi:hypothetical protein BO70DRAFT_364720 [Aspergillus heteromorphus CBS 117.55]|uniref:Uncharacterized protein n=1 Tax=Aspergillus heteromorphus CBS 117.55 TaxID=1448321 RepID=A0A317VM03_9EURO|nr:uncharacterized protein BO70DRAFT_364720 [Aspergillus heteromorphus CBS 117.55]PWY72940.1 hypothetical protein BO70DRAFT_364720 [Aspergillus heteromorphus CBS 117.55]